MKIKNKTIIKTACFLTAFAVIGAGFAYKYRLLEIKYREREKVYDTLTLTDCSENLERLSDSLSSYIESEANDRYKYLSDIRLYAERAKISLGYLKLEGNSSEELFSFLNAASAVSEKSLKNAVVTVHGEEVGISSEWEFEHLSSCAKRIASEALPFLNTSLKSFSKEIEKIFSSTLTDTILYENGHIDLAASNDFSTLSKGTTDEEEALKTAKKHLGAKAYLKLRATETEPRLYHIEGENISAVVSCGGGFLIQFLFDLPEKDITVTESEAKIKSDTFLRELGFYPENTEAYPPKLNGSMYVFTYAPYGDGNILCLNEKLTVGVSGGSGRICLFDASDYYRYHKRTIDVAETLLTASEAASFHGFSPEQAVLCKINLETKAESLAYRFKTQNGDRFVNAFSGELN